MTKLIQTAVDGLGVGSTYALLALGISLAAVGATALVGVGPRIWSGQVELGTSLLFAVAGMLGAPIGTWVASMIPELALLTLFAAIMLFVAWKMWQSSARSELLEPVLPDQNRQASCHRNKDGQLELTSRCAILLLIVGVATGIMSGMFGVGGGFIIVPALVLFSGMSMHKAVGTSLLVIVLVSISGVASHIAAGRGISLAVTALFAVGGIVGMALGSRLAKRLPALLLQRVFAMGIVAVALLVASQSLV